MYGQSHLQLLRGALTFHDVESANLRIDRFLEYLFMSQSHQRRQLATSCNLHGYSAFQVLTQEWTICMNLAGRILHQYLYSLS